jgi:hypothetical protein
MGGRYWHQELDVDLDLAGTANVGGLIVSGNRAIAKSGSVDWIDPFLGARLRYALSPGEEIALRGDVGGFGAGSQFTPAAMATWPNWFELFPHTALATPTATWLARAVGRPRGGTAPPPAYSTCRQQGPGDRVTGRF